MKLLGCGTVSHCTVCSFTLRWEDEYNLGTVRPFMPQKLSWDTANRKADIIYAFIIIEGISEQSRYRSTKMLQYCATV